MYWTSALRTMILGGVFSLLISTSSLLSQPAVASGKVLSVIPPQAQKIVQTTLTDPESASSLRRAEVQTARELIAAGQWPALDNMGDPKGMQSFIDSLPNGEAEIWFHPAAGLNFVGLELASRAYLQEHQAPPANIQALAPYCFAWPMTKPDASWQAVPRLVGSDAVLGEGTTWTPGTGEEQLAAAALSGESLDITSAYALPSDTNAGKVEFVYRTRRYSLANRYLSDDIAPQLAVVPASDSSQSVADRNDQLMTYLQHCTNPQDVRVGTAYRTLARVIQSAAGRTGSLPVSLQEVQLNGGVRFEQLQEAAPDAADIIIEFDGKQAYRTSIRLSNGEVVQTTAIYYELHPLDATAVSIAEGELPLRSGQEWLPFASLRLRNPSQALPPNELAPHAVPSLLDKPMRVPE